MSKYLGIDTSNYTTSLAVYDSENGTFINLKKLLEVKSGEKGLRQSDAVFQHTVNLPALFEKLSFVNGEKPSAVGVSVSPTAQPGSYMPCFLAGVSAAAAVSKTNSVPLYKFSHQQGHIAAVLVSSCNEDMLNQEFYAFHLSGGTTDLLYVKPDKENLLDITLLASSLDLKAGQAVDRTGVMLGLDFPCGAALDRLANESVREYMVSPYINDGNCSLSGIENKCKKMLECGEKPCDIAKFCISSIIVSVEKMLEYQFKINGEKPVVFCGGVSCNSELRKRFSKYNAVFSAGEYSADNAAGIAYLAYLRDKVNLHD